MKNFFQTIYRLPEKVVNYLEKIVAGCGNKKDSWMSILELTEIQRVTEFLKI